MFLLDVWDKTPWDESPPGFRVGSTWRWHSRGRLGVLIHPPTFNIQPLGKWVNQRTK